MPFYTYILFSQTTGRYYCGQTDHIEFRLIRHNNGEVTSTKHGAPWKLIGFLVFDSRREAMLQETKIKKRGIKRWLDEFSHLLSNHT